MAESKPHHDFDSAAFLQRVTDQPGIYQMYDAQDKVIYVGKARNLKKRLKSYFKARIDEPKTRVLVKHIQRIDVTVTETENEALLLESNLIKKLKPRYNVLLRDDKSYPYIYLSTQDDFPRMDIYRGKLSKKGRYFGPYPSAGAVRETLNLLQKLFLIRQCSPSFFNSRSRPCLQYQIKRCTAPCVAYINKEEYAKSVYLAEMFLSGKSQSLINDLVLQMQRASDAMEFETAAHLRDTIANLRKVQAQQVVSKTDGDIDVIALEAQAGGFCVQVLTIRGGRILGSQSYFPRAHESSSTAEVLSQFITQYYLNPVRVQQIPKRLILNTEVADKKWLVNFLSEQAKHKVLLDTQVRGVRLQWLQMAQNNAQVALTSHLSTQANTFQRLEALQKLLQLESLPQRLECFDISHSHGEATVASCVVFDINGPAKQHYRRFNIHDITPGDDYAAMKQALLRRYTKLKSKEEYMPDVLFIDGGKGQLSQARAVLEECQVSSVLLVGIAKGEGRKPGLETLFVGDDNKVLNPPPHSPALHLIQQIRDEAHRFAITGHRNRRDKRRKTSPLQSIPGIGPKRRQQLLQQFGGLQALKAASIDELATVPGISRPLAEKIHKALLKL